MSIAIAARAAPEARALDLPTPDPILDALTARTSARIGARWSALVELRAGWPPSALAHTGTGWPEALAVAATQPASDRRRSGDRAESCARLGRDGSILALGLGNEGAARWLFMAGPPGGVWADSADTALLDLQPWLADTMRLFARARDDRARADELATALDAPALAIALVDARGTVRFANLGAHSLLDAGDGLRRMAGGLTAAALDDAVRLQTAIQHVAAQDPLRPAEAVPVSSPVVMIKRRHARPLLVVIVPAGGSACLLIVDPDIDIERLAEPACRLYGLTGVEARLARLLVGGLTLSEAGDRLRVKPETARAYLKAIFAKTGAHRQAELVRVLMSSLLPTAAHIRAVTL